RFTSNLIRHRMLEAGAAADPNGGHRWPTRLRSALSHGLDRLGIAQAQVGVVLVLAHIRPALPAPGAGRVVAAAVDHPHRRRRAAHRRLGEAVIARPDQVLEVHTVALQLLAYRI